MMKYKLKSRLLLVPALALSFHSLAQEKITIDWKNTGVVSKTTPTLQVVFNPMVKRNSSIHASTFKALKDLKVNYVRYVPWFPYPQAAVVELKEPTKTETFWDFSHADETVEDIMKSQDGRSVVMNFSTIPVWMFKNPKPVEIPADPDEPFWNYNQGKELRDPSGKEVADYFARLFSWYTKGGFTDELGKFHKSNYHYKFPYWEVLNEPDLEHRVSPQLYTTIYDAVVTELKKISPETKFVGMSLAHEDNPEFFEYFLNPANHKPGVPLEGISYHFYGRPTYAGLTIDNYQNSFFDQANGFLDRVRFVESVRKRLAPNVFTQINELGTILENRDFKGVIPNEYWNVSGAMYAYLFIELTKLGIDVAGESQLVGYPTQFPDVSMMNWKTGDPNARYWILKLIVDNFGPGDQLVAAKSSTPGVVAQGFITKEGKRLMLINRKNTTVDMELPQGAGSISFVDPETGDKPYGSRKIDNNKITLKPFSVSVISY